MFFRSILSRLAALFDPETLGVAIADLLANLIIGAATFAAYYLLWRLLDAGARMTTRRLEVDATSRDFSLTILKFAVLTFAAVNALAAVGVNTASLLTSLGIAGLTIGFAARDALSNMISGLLIYWDRPFVIGDLVDIGTSHPAFDSRRDTRRAHAGRAQHGDHQHDGGVIHELPPPAHRHPCDRGRRFGPVGRARDPARPRA
jgi:small conductance mechanosensitive channel